MTPAATRPNTIGQHAPAEAGGALIAAMGVHKTYRLGRVSVSVLRGVDLAVRRGEWVAILGASGSGKSTLLHLLGGLDRPDSHPPGRVFYDGQPLNNASSGRLDEYRNTSVGLVFQFYHLLPELSVVQNVCTPAMIRYGRFGYLARRGSVETRAAELLNAFGLGDRLKHRPAELSGGERQRVAIARALINQPPVLLADEPTGNLDQKTGNVILDLIAEQRRRENLTLVMVTHDQAVAARADRVVRLQDGKVVSDSVG